MNFLRKHQKALYSALLTVYAIAVFCGAVVFRAPLDRREVKTEWFWGYKMSDPAILYGDNLYNILLFLPVGCLVGLIAPKHKVLWAMFVGLFVSETIECSQLIWQRGVFDVDDILNNVAGALLGGLLVALATEVRNLVRRKRSASDRDPEGSCRA